MVNRVLGLLRQPRVTSLVSPSTVTTETMDLVNRSARTVLEQRNWSFLGRDMGLRIFSTRTGIGTGVSATTSLVIPPGAISIGDLTNGVTRFHVVVTSDPLVPHLLIPISTALVFVGNVLNFEAAVPDITANGACSWALHGNVGVFAPTVGRILHVYDEERPLRLAFGDRYDLHRFEADWARSTGDPEVIFVGGSAAPTGLFPAVGTVGSQFLVWPPPSQNRVLWIDYLFRHASLANDSDTLTGVPEHVSDLMVLLAAVEGLYGTIANDPARGVRLEAMYERGLARAMHSDDPQVFKRRIPRPFGSGRRGDPWADWESRQVPVP